MDTLEIAKTWVDFGYHVFDKVWPFVATTLGGFLTGWLGVNKPEFMKKAGG